MQVCGVCINNSPVHKGTNHVPEDVSGCDSDPFLIWKPDFTLCERKALSNQAFETPKKEAFWIVIHVGSLILRKCERKALSERDSCVAEAMHGSISADCAVGAKYYLAVRRSCSWLGRCLQCMWTHIHVVQITIPIRKRIAIQNSFRNMILSFVNRPSNSLKLTPFSGCEFHAFLQKDELMIQWPRELHRRVVCQFTWPIVDTHTTHSHRLSIEVNISTVKTILPHFESLPLKMIYYNWIVMRKWGIK